MDINSIFSLFEPEKSSSLNENLYTDVSANQPKEKSSFETITVVVGVFNNLILNSPSIIEARLGVLASKMNLSLDEETKQRYIVSISEACYNDAYSGLSTFKLSDPEFSDFLVNCFDKKVFIESLQKAISFFEKRDEFEKCNHLVSILNFLKHIEFVENENFF